MKKILLLLLIGLFTFDVDAQLLSPPESGGTSLPGLSKSDEFSFMAVKKRKKRKSSRRRSSSKGRGKSTQGGLNVGGGLTLGLPMGDFADAVKTGAGLHVEGDYFVMPEFSAGISTGYISFKNKTESGESGKFNILPVMIKGNYYFMQDEIKPYIGLAVGLFFDQSTFENSWPTIFENPVTSQLDTVMFSESYTDNTTDFAVAPMAGVLFNVADNLSINLGARYNIFSLKDASDKKQSFNFLGLQFGLIYTLGF